MPNAIDVAARLEALIAKGEQSLATKRDYGLDMGPFAEWRSQSNSFLIGLLGTEHVYVRRFEDEVQDPLTTYVSAGIGILKAVREDAELGLLTGVRERLAGEIFADFLEMAEHLLNDGFHFPAASLIGAVLEDGLRKVADARGVVFGERDGAGGISSKLLRADVFTPLQHRRLQTTIEVRNLADHGKFDQFAATDVRDMLNTVEAFLAEHLGRKSR